MSEEHQPLSDGVLPDDLEERAGDRLLAARGAARETVLAELIAAHPEHEAQLRRLCSDLGGVDRLLQAGYPDPTGDAPSHIGGHRVLRRLGEGAFGVVYLCAQERPVVREVAIKVLRPGAGDPKTLQRFAAERQLLAQLNHPGITQVFDAGELPDGRPFFVMEYVDGTPIHAWCVARELLCPDRVRLFADLCRAVAHAHARGIVHRDLKPANVLVVATSDGPVPKVIDFGIAKALGGTDADGEPRTETGRVIGTPGYMSPEQAAGRTDQVDARADVFALGVMLYQLLTDRLPWPRPSAPSETEPLRPSARVTTDDGTTTRTVPRPRLAAELRGDLDWITLKAIARDRDERYASVADLLSDIERHLRGETVSAGPPSLAYRLRKFVRRRRAAVIAGVCIVVAAAGSALALTQASRSAEAGLADSRSFVARLLERANDPALFGTAHGDDVRKALGAEAVAFTDRLLATRSDDPALLTDRCEALLTVAEVQALLGESSRAKAAAAQAVETAQRLCAAAPEDLHHRGRLGRALRQLGRANGYAGDQATAYADFVAAIGHLEACAALDEASWRRPLATALAEMARIVPKQEAGAAVVAFERALALFGKERQDAAARAATQSDYVSAVLGLGWQLHAERRFDAAMEQTDLVAGELTSLGHTRLRSTVDFHRLRGAIARSRREWRTAATELEAAVVAADAWCQQQPRRVITHRLLQGTLDDLGNAANYAGDFDASSAAHRRAIGAAEAMVTQFPDDPTTRSALAARHQMFAFMLWERFRLQPLEEAAAHVARAFQIDDTLGDQKIDGRTPRWRLLALRADIDESRGLSSAAATWLELERAVPLEAVPGDFARDVQVGAFTGIARMRLRSGEPAVAASWLARARAIADAHAAHKKRSVEVSWLEARIAFDAHDSAAVVAAADRIVAARPTWFGVRRAADCLLLAARCEAEADASSVHRERARAYYAKVVEQLDADVAKSPDDPWFVLPWGAAMIRLAEFAAEDGDTTTALDQVDRALARLDAARPDAHRDQWDEDAWTAGVALRNRLRR